MKQEGETDNTGENKYIIAVQTKQELSRWMGDLYPAPDEQEVYTSCGHRHSDAKCIIFNAKCIIFNAKFIILMYNASFCIIYL